MTYRPPYFRVDDRYALLEAIAQSPLATLVTTDGADLQLSHLPMLARIEDGTVILQGHLARANDHWRHPAASAVAAFRVSDHYISPSWYPTKARDPRTVPTFNYVTVEARGPVRFVDDESWLLAFLRRFTDDRERRVGETWSIDDAPLDYVLSQVGAIVGVEMRVQTLHGTYKLNQNHPEEDIDGVISALRAVGTPAANGLRSVMISVLKN